MPAGAAAAGTLTDLSASLGLTRFELATGYVGGSEFAAPPALPGVPAELSPLQALEQAVLPALERGPTFVTFSGGRDSSTVLAAATRVARRHELGDPIPITVRFPNAPGAAESEWQELVINHLGIEDWRILEFDDELDYVGPIAQSVLLRHGVMYPFNTHFLLPLLEEAGSGTLLTGTGGDALFQTWRWQHEWLMLTGRARPRLRRLPRLAYFASPLPLRAFVASRIRLPRRPWLTDHGQSLLRRAIAQDADEPRRFDARVPWIPGRRYYTVSIRAGEILAAEAGVRVEHPYLDGHFLATLAREGGRTGPGDRTAAMRRFFGGLLPDDLLSRRTKASFSEAYFNVHSRRFLSEWDGPSPFPEVVDAEGFRNAWREGDSFTPRLLLQATWLASARGLG